MEDQETTLVPSGAAALPVDQSQAAAVEIDMDALDKEPKFECCWADEDREICEVVLGTTTFRMRSLTAGEANKIQGMVQVRLPKHAGDPSEQHKTLYARSVGKSPEEMTEDDIALLKKLLSGSVVGMNGAAIIRLTVGAALGMWKKYGTEGWADSNWGEPREVTLEQLDCLKEEALSFLWRKHNKFFRSE